MRYITIIFFLLLSVPAHAATLKNCMDTKGYEGEDFDACVFDLVQRNGDVALCDHMERPRSASECIGQVLKNKKVTEAQCSAFKNHKDICLDRLAGKEYPLTMQDCDAMEPGYEDYDWCLWDLAVQNKDVTICGMFITRSGVAECVDRIAELTMITEVACRSMYRHNDVCFEKIGKTP